MTADIKALASRVYDAFNARDIAAVEELFAPDSISHASGICGTDGVKQALASLYATFPDVRFVVEDLLADGDKAALRVTIHGIPRAPGQPQPIIMEIFRIKHGRVVEVWGAGTLPPPAFSRPGIEGETPAHG